MPELEMTMIRICKTRLLLAALGVGVGVAAWVVWPRGAQFDRECSDNLSGLLFQSWAIEAAYGYNQRRGFHCGQSVTLTPHKWFA